MNQKEERHDGSYLYLGLGCGTEIFWEQYIYGSFLEKSISGWKWTHPTPESSVREDISCFHHIVCVQRLFSWVHILPKPHLWAILRPKERHLKTPLTIAQLCIVIRDCLFFYKFSNCCVSMISSVIGYEQQIQTMLWHWSFLETTIRDGFVIVL